ncbi:MAG: hypothetical protein WHS87_02775 [Anaerolineales bacterium]
MDDRITIIEGPPPVFEVLQEAWPMSLWEGARPVTPALTRLRTFNGAALVERCYRAWHNQQPIHLYYRDAMGLEQSAPILAARYVTTSEGDVLLLIVALDPEELEFESNFGDEGQDDYPFQEG